ncbi:hypothetical protein E1193_13380 [Micromonospora sp. KC606]|uniref:hypothetical protein n=1 Tax=Micromonospora sp. KC606 TaxID=2530379 RepID=UPI001050AA41|nr:hypothetical protein [Micromonospora sp. KC606]TDC81890.1 hypothetical protein E1193_13380 [Micromonospora sp. KC606]
MIYAAGRHWGTDRELAAALGPDVTPAMIRRWRDRDGLTTIEGRSPLDEAATIEAAKRRSTRGRPRRLDPAAVPA